MIPNERIPSFRSISRTVFVWHLIQFSMWHLFLTHRNWSVHLGPVWEVHNFCSDWGRRLKLNLLVNPGPYYMIVLSELWCDIKWGEVGPQNLVFTTATGQFFNFWGSLGLRWVFWMAWNVISFHIWKLFYYQTKFQSNVITIGVFMRVWKPLQAKITPSDHGFQASIWPRGHWMMKMKFIPNKHTCLNIQVMK